MWTAAGRGRHFHAGHGLLASAHLPGVTSRTHPARNGPNPGMFRRPMEQTVTGERPVFRTRQLFGGRSIAFPYVVAKRVGAGLKGNVRLMASFGTVLLILALAVACMPPAASPGDSKTATGEAPVPTHEATAEATAEDTSPPGDCWGGALSEGSASHCYVVEQAQVGG